MMLPSPRHLKPVYEWEMPRWHTLLFWSFLLLGMLSVIHWSLSSWRDTVMPFAAIASLIGLACVWYLKRYHQSRYHQTRQELLDALGIRGNEQILVLNSGSCFMVSGLAQKMTAGRVVGIDPRYTSSQMSQTITTAEENVRREGVADQVELYSDTLTKLPFSDARFDVVVDVELNRDAGMNTPAEELNRVLKPTGRLLIMKHRSTEPILSALQKMGFVTQTESKWRHGGSKPSLCLLKKS